MGQLRAADVAPRLLADLQQIPNINAVLNGPLGVQLCGFGLTEPGVVAACAALRRPAVRVGGSMPGNLNAAQTVSNGSGISATVVSGVASWVSLLAAVVAGVTVYSRRPSSTSPEQIKLIQAVEE